MSNSYDILLQKLKRYKNKYYTVKAINGVIIFTAIFMSAAILISLLLFYFYITAKIKTFLFISTVIALLAAFAELVLWPLIKMVMFNVKKENVTIAKLIAKQDNSLALNIETALDLYNLKENKLAIAAVEQKISKLKTIDFAQLISWKSTVKYLKYFGAISIIVLYFTLFHQNEVYTGAKNFLSYRSESEVRQPFKFILQNNSLSLTQGQDITIKVKIEGSYLPQEVFININGNKFLMSRTSNKNIFEYRIKRLNQNTLFYFEADKYRSKEYEIKVRKLPVVKNFSVTVTPPSYTGKKTETYSNSTDLKVTEGSTLNIKINGINIDKLLLKDGNNQTKETKLAGKNTFTVNYFVKDATVLRFLTNDSSEILKLNIRTIKDKYPEIDVHQFKDSMKLSLIYFVGTIYDDYGFHGLKFFYKISGKTYTKQLPVNKNLNTQQFYYYFDFDSLLEKSPDITYFFEVRDNDAINGYKSTQSEHFSIHKPEPEDVFAELDSSSANIEDNYNKSFELTMKIREQINDIRRQLLNEEISQWERKTLLDELKKKQTELQELIKQTNQEIKKKNALLNTYVKDPELLKKQIEIQKMLEDLLNDDMKKLMEELNKLMQESNLKELSKKLENLDYNYKNLAEDLDRTFELLKREEIKQQLNEQAELINQISEQQQKLAEKTKTGKENKFELMDKQSELKFKTDFLKNSYKNTLQKNEKLERPYKLPELDSLFKTAENLMEKSQEELNKNNRRKAAKLQKQASETLEKIARKMSQALQSSSMTVNYEDIQNLKKIISDLVYFSFGWEDIYERTTKAYVNSKEFQEILAKANNLGQEFVYIQDSIWSLAKRTPQISKPVITDLRKIIKNNKEILNLLQDYNKNKALTKNRQIIADINDLTLLLSEILKQMEQAMKNASSGSGDKQNAMKQMGQMKQSQQSLEEQLKQMLEQMKKGGKPSAEQLAKALAQQQLLEQLLEEFMNNETLSPEIRKTLNEIKKLNDQTQKDIIYKNISTETLIRQQQIKVKLLETENALKKQGKENKRKAEQPVGYKKREPSTILKNYEKQLKNTEPTKNQEIKLNNFYKNYFSNYLNLIR